MVFLCLMMYLVPLDSKASVWSCAEFDSLSTQQRSNLIKSYHRASQEDLGYTLAAIAWKESSAGKFRVNYRSNDYGLYGINVRTVQRLTGEDNYYRTVEVVQRLIQDDDLGADVALTTLRWNLKYHKGDWQKAIMMYNAGHKWRTAKSYLFDIATYVNVLKNCLTKDQVVSEPPRFMLANKRRLD